MYFIDEAKIFLKSGDGGNGCVGFRREKFIEFGGPDGGNGGFGGNIIFVAKDNLNTLVDFRYKQHFKAQRGGDGKGSNCAGKYGKDMIIEVPVGTQIFLEDGTEMITDINYSGQQYLIAKGGRGGAGNAAFKSSTNQAPKFAKPGEPGEELWVWLKLKLLSDIGLIGLPNAGKSTFLSVVSAAEPKIADYPFTTITPNLGVVYVDNSEFVIADIPGLIKGASQGHGLGDRFLKHVERCKALLHLIDISSDIVVNYNIIMEELKTYSPKLIEKKQVIALNKTDLLSDEEIAIKQQQLRPYCKDEIFLCSGATTYGINKLTKALLATVK